MTNVAHGIQLKDPMMELAARADAGQKLAMQSLEFLMVLAQRNGLKIDFSSAAEGMTKYKFPESMDPEAKLIENRSREIVANILFHFDAVQGKLK